MGGILAICADGDNRFTYTSAAAVVLLPPVCYIDVSLNQAI
jgi:hypothetical protein